MLVGTLGASLLGNMLAGKGFIRTREETAKVGYGSKRSSFLKKFDSPRPLTNFEIQMYYQNEPKLNGVHSRENSRDKIKDGAHVINFDVYSDIGTHWIGLYVNTKTMTYFDSFGVEHITKEIKKFADNKNIITNIFRIQAYDSVMCGYFCIGLLISCLKTIT